MRLRGRWLSMPQMRVTQSSRHSLSSIQLFIAISSSEIQRMEGFDPDKEKVNGIGYRIGEIYMLLIIT